VALFQSGRLDSHYPKVCGHQGNVLDIKWNPFFENVIASCSEDTSVSDPLSFISNASFTQQVGSGWWSCKKMWRKENILYLFVRSRGWPRGHPVIMTPWEGLRFRFCIGLKLVSGLCLSAALVVEPLAWKWQMTDAKCFWARHKCTSGSVTDCTLLVSDVTWHILRICAPVTLLYWVLSLVEA